MKQTTLFLSALSLLAACVPPKPVTGSSSASNTTTADFSKLTPSCFAPEASLPILSKGSLFAGATWNDPHIIKEGNFYVMYASADTNFNGDIKIYRLQSTDGVSFTLAPSYAVLSKGTGGADWDRKSVETPAVVKFNSTYYLFYTGYPTTSSDPKTYQIGYATAPDGVTFTKQAPRFAPNDPTNTTPNLSFNQWIVAEPAPVVFNNKIYLYFTALGADVSVGTTLQTIGLVKSSNGVTWTSPTRVLSPDQTLYPRGSAGSGLKGYSTPHAVVLNNQVHLFFTVIQETAGGDRQIKLHHARSADGETGWIHDTQEIFERSEFTPWADQDLRSPALHLEGKELLMWFAGNGDTSGFPNVQMGIGLARCAL